MSINPEFYMIRCKRCGEFFTLALMLKTYRDRQRDAPPGKIFVRCPKCRVTEFLNDPNVALLLRDPPRILRRPRKKKENIS